MISTISDYLERADERFCHAIAHIGKPHASIGYALFHAYVIRQECRDPEFANHIHEIHYFLNGLNVVMLIWNICDLARFDYVSPITASAVTIAAIALGILIVRDLNKYLYRSDPNTMLSDEVVRPEEGRRARFEWVCPLNQKISHGLYTMGLIINIAAAYFSHDRAIYVVNAVMHCYCLFAISSLKWLKLTRTFNLISE